MCTQSVTQKIVGWKVYGGGSNPANDYILVTTVYMYRCRQFVHTLHRTGIIENVSNNCDFYSVVQSQSALLIYINTCATLRERNN